MHFLPYPEISSSRQRAPSVLQSSVSSFQPFYSGHTDPPNTVLLRSHNFLLLLPAIYRVCFFRFFNVWYRKTPTAGTFSVLPMGVLLCPSLIICTFRTKSTIRAPYGASVAKPEGSRSFTPSHRFYWWLVTCSPHFQRRTIHLRGTILRHHRYGHGHSCAVDTACGSGNSFSTSCLNF